MIRTSPLAMASAAAIAFVGARPAHAQDDGLALSGSVRLRVEEIEGQARAGFDRKDSLFNIRTQLMAEYRSGAFRAGAELFDSRAYGADAGTPISTNEINAMELVQAYVAGDIDEPLGKGSKLGLMAGRFMLNLGSRRLVAADDYRNTTNGYTGLRADLTAPRGVKAVFIYTLPQQRRPDDAEGVRNKRVRFDHEGFDLVLWGGIVSKAKAIGPAMAELTYFHLGERDEPGRPTRDRSLDTFGGRIISEPETGRFDYEVEAFYQTGSVSASLAPGAVRQSVAASFLHVDAGYSFSGPWKPRLSLEFDRASGDRRGGRQGRFDTLFGMRRADLAPAGLYNALARTNIVTPGIRLEATPDKRWDWFATYRALWLASRTDAFSSTGVRDASGRSGSFAGHQVEGRVRHWIVPSRLRFEFDGLLLAKGRFLRDAPNATAGKWTRYTSFNLTASF
ncbi:alginate export family protein [Sphingobium sp. RSMS]|uniref:alginate export family protein n=1 Tax=Sphingobium sp. RSMS TaxID=520734 RepID=UPI0020A397F6|nr:alginate export family protein [Sphingobium sp. RSMS]UXC91391.1 alginate export family protein [Sphingobium sp. RSMS]